MTNAEVPPATRDSRSLLLEQLRDLIPGAFPDGVLDSALLLAAVSDTGGQPSGFTFTWPGLEGARDAARSATTATLVPDIKASVNWHQARDALVQGDNLQVLKLLKSGYDRQAKLIYIDPPYNTGQTFNYNDAFSVPESEYLRATGQLDEQGNATTSRIESAGRKHAPWLSFMFPRLSVARGLLRRDGVILVSIDNNEVHHLRLLLDAVFGADNFVDMMTWRGARKGDGKLTAGGQDYILVYARDLAHLKTTDARWREKKTGLAAIYEQETALRTRFGDDYESATQALRAWFKSLPDEDPSKAHAHYSTMDGRGVFFPGDISSPNPRPNMMYDWKGYSVPAAGWRYEKPTMERLDAEGRLLYPDSKTKRIQVKRYLEEHEDWAPASVFYRDRRAASGALKDLMGSKVFDNPKNTDVLARLFSAMTSDDDLIVDFFAGSGSTGQAVWELNQVDGMRRRWVLVQIPEIPDVSEESGRNAVEAGYATIFDVTAERLRRSALLPSTQQVATGFRIFRAGPSNLHIDPPAFVTEDTTNTSFFDSALFEADAAPVLEGADPLAVAWEVVLKSTATRLDARVEVVRVGDVNVYEFSSAQGGDGGRLLVCLDEFTLQSADALGLADADTLILRGDIVDDSVTLTLAPRLQSRLVLLERITREVSL
jgi:adenine-specific DNA-methyltransferase